MKKTGLLLLLVLLPVLLFGAFALAEETPEEMDEWTVMFYFCGSDLESKYGYATGNLEEISQVMYPDDFNMAASDYRAMPSDSEAQPQPGKVNLLLETGGSKEWHARELGMEVDAGALQRWRYNVYPWGGMGAQDGVNGYELLETLPLQSMADPETLADFIRWGKATCPAKKYALVLWGHGDGAHTGLLIDELFDRDVMYLYELKQALADADTHLEVVIVDACLMANIETAWAVKDSADWMVASEEVVPGNGTAVSSWLQQLFNNPWGDGEWLGRCVCDTTAIKYADAEDEQARSTITWSVIDLSGIDALTDSARRFFGRIGETLEYNPDVSTVYMRRLSETVECGDGQQNMRDFGSLLYNADMVHYMAPALLSRMIQALTDTIAYNVRGVGRSEARGLSFCYPMNFSDEELDQYAKNYPVPEYLSFIDAVSDWTAPDWVYESTGRLPKIDSIEVLRLYLQRKLNTNGTPGVLFRMGDVNLDDVYYRLYRLDEETGEVLYLGRTNCTFESTEDFDLLYFASDPMHWPAIDGELICMDLIKVYADRKLYNVPVRINGQNSMLRLNRWTNFADDESGPLDEYEVIGAWEGENANGDLMNRSLKPLSQLVKLEYQLLYPIDGTAAGGKTVYRQSAPLVMYRSLDVQEIPLPAGTYYLEYEVDDVFMRTTVLDRIEIRWDGETMTFPGADRWENGEWVKVAELRAQ